MFSNSFFDLSFLNLTLTTAHRIAHHEIRLSAYDNSYNLNIGSTSRRIIMMPKIHDTNRVLQFRYKKQIKLNKSVLLEELVMGVMYFKGGGGYERHDNHDHRGAGGPHNSNSQQ